MLKQLGCAICDGWVIDKARSSVDVANDSDNLNDGINRCNEFYGSKCVKCTDLSELIRFFGSDI